jgi:hypothetical protein
MPNMKGFNRADNIHYRQAIGASKDPERFYRKLHIIYNYTNDHRQEAYNFDN